MEEGCAQVVQDSEIDLRPHRYQQSPDVAKEEVDQIAVVVVRLEH